MPILKKIELFYKLTQDSIISPYQEAIARKDKFIADIQKTVQAEYEPKIIKVTYELVNPEIEKQRRFFHTAIKFYAIQNEDMFEEEPSYELLRKYREELLDELLGYDVVLVTKTLRKRESTKDFKNVQQWNDLIRLFEETVFEKAGYYFPDSKKFWTLIEDENMSYEQADRIIKQRLQKTIKARLHHE